LKKPRWLSASAARAIHGELLAEHGGPTGGDDDRLESTLVRPKNAAAYEDANLAELAASYGFGFAKNHCFVDGNKRMALAAMSVFLLLNGKRLSASETEAVAVIMDLATDEMTEIQLAKWIRKNTVSR